MTNLLLVSELLWSIAENIIGTQVTMKKQEGQSLVMRIRKQLLYAFLQLATNQIVSLLELYWSCTGTGHIQKNTSQAEL